MFYQHVQTAIIDEASIPWMPFAPCGAGVVVKHLKADPVSGKTITLTKARAGAELPRHRHSGPTTIYTIEGRWKYREHAWIASPGSVVTVPAGACHTACVLGQDTLTLSILVGDLVFVDQDGTVLATENWKSAVERYDAYCKAALIEPRDITACN